MGLDVPYASSEMEQNRRVDQPTHAFPFATEADALAIATLRTGVAAHLTRTFGQGPWSHVVTERAVSRDLKTARVLVARRGASIAATMTLAGKKPWAIDLAYFTAVPKALYVHAMAVAPDMQRQGLGRDLVREAIAVARAWPSQAIRLDAYQAAAGAGGFYAKCGFREVGRVTYRTVPLIYFELLL
jgi:ribosomal protein S18 acetylase RimI-like enzyme